MPCPFWTLMISNQATSSAIKLPLMEKSQPPVLAVQSTKVHERFLHGIAVRFSSPSMGLHHVKFNSA